VLGLVAAEATQAVGALLLLGLLSAPAGAAHRLTSNPYAGIGLAAALALAATWGGLVISYLVPDLPPSSMIISLAVGTYLVASLATRTPKLESIS
jgi:zinc/manganese transport system permease protein